jgi:hypothetical protein
MPVKRPIATADKDGPLAGGLAQSLPALIFYSILLWIASHCVMNGEIL